MRTLLYLFRRSCWNLIPWRLRKHPFLLLLILAFLCFLLAREQVQNILLERL